MLPVIEMHNGFHRMMLDGKPFPMLAGELHNSSFSSLEYMESQVLPWLRNLNLNTVVLPIAWENVEPKEGVFDFDLLRGILQQARGEQLRLVLLWFGLWKNGESHYVPEWVKTDRERFFRAKYPDGKEMETVSPFCEAAVEADAAAFRRLMAFLKKEDTGNTVILVQVENEMGILGADRDYSAAANAAFRLAVPEDAARYAGNQGSWQELFGADAAEYFMAAQYAKVTNRIAEAGQQEKRLPMYVNAWLGQHPDRAGIYPSGGPVAKLIPLWQALAPALDMICPDIYRRDFGTVVREYAANGNPLFIPEAGRNAKAASRVFYAFAMGAMGFSPFGIEDLCKPQGKPMDESQLAQLNIMQEAFYSAGTSDFLPESYRILKGLYPVLDDRCAGFLQENPYDPGTILEYPDCGIQLDYLPGQTGSGGLVLRTENGFYIAGCNTRFTLLPPKGKHLRPEILRMEEGKFHDGIWQRSRILNGDELWLTFLGEMPEVKYVRFQTV